MTAITITKLICGTIIVLDKDYTDLSDSEREEMAKKLTKRMGETLNEYYTTHKLRGRISKCQ